MERVSIESNVLKMWKSRDTSCLFVGQFHAAVTMQWYSMQLVLRVPSIDRRQNFHNFAFVNDWFSIVDRINWNEISHFYWWHFVSEFQYFQFFISIKFPQKTQKLHFPVPPNPFNKNRMISIFRINSIHFDDERPASHRRAQQSSSKTDRANVLKQSTIHCVVSSSLTERAHTEHSERATAAGTVCVILFVRKH